MSKKEERIIKAGLKAAVFVQQSILWAATN
jgi:hypothetical protein